MKKLLTIIVLSIATLFCSNNVFAATAPRVYFTATNLSIAPDSEVVVSLFIDSAESINAFDLEVNYPKDKLKFLKVDDAESIVNIWQTKGKLLDNGNIGLSGGLFKPFSGNKGLLIKLYFKTLTSGEPRLTLPKSDVFLFDGKGTRIMTSTNSLSFSVSLDAPVISSAPELPADSTPPIIIFDLVKNPSDGTPLLSFNATDIESGILKTEMRIKKWFSWSDWESVENPVFYPKGVWKIELRATNNAGVESVRALSYPSTLLAKALIPILVVTILVFVIVLVYNKRKRNNIQPI